MKSPGAVAGWWGLAILLLAAGTASGQGHDDRQRRMLDSVEADRLAQTQAPIRRGAGKTARFPRDLRSIDGRSNNLKHRRWGSANSTYLRLVPPAYADDRSEPSGAARPGAREISNLCAAASEPKLNKAKASDFLWLWGQFLDHDITLTPVVAPAERFDIPVPAGDAWFDPGWTGSQLIPLERSVYRKPKGVRQQLNEITAFIDASNVYGSDRTRARALRTLDGTGRLKTSKGELLPYNTAGLPNAPNDSARFFLAGDFRANEHVGLSAIHTLFVREHNFWAEMLKRNQPQLDGEEIYQHARAIVAAEMQSITYNEFLPALLGRDAMSQQPKKKRYRKRVNPGISNVFAAAAYRMGHSMLSPSLLRLDGAGEAIAAGHLSLAEAFFRPEEIAEHGIDSILRGMAAQRAREIDNVVIDDVRNFLFGPPGAGGFDLAALNIQRGRDHGLASYNDVRAAIGLAPATSFADVSPDPKVQANLAVAYGGVDDMDLWVAGLAEPHLPGAMVGETFWTILVEQFDRLRRGDRFWYESYLPAGLVALVERQTLSRIIRRNTEIGSELPDNVFRVRDN